MAIKRKNAKNEFAKLKVQLMMKQYKKAEYLQMLKQREKIYQIQIRSAIVQFSEIVLKRWKSQEYTSELFVTIKNLQSQLKEVSQQVKYFLKLYLQHLSSRKVINTYQYSFYSMKKSGNNWNMRQKQRLLPDNRCHHQN